ncbi:MAG: hypothetical protein JJU32_00805 [Phormidium sp. BM_Day4_Bin.17]|nr:hypothetical protein [Phormidium sp. BM_Day4_Bin.17]UCJ11519.1 MAG: hypothetical protein JWS08_17445 [Phormidium sp. PBR-2020]
MNKKLVQSLVEVIFSLSEEEQDYLQREIGKHSLTQEIVKIEQKLEELENKYQMKSDDFYRQFQAGNLEDSMDFFEWNTYYEMLMNANIKAS